MLINLRNALTAGKRLPYDAEVEYLESTGTQWIDTGINAKQSLKIRAVFETNSTTSYFAYGVRAGDSTISCATGIRPSGTGYARWGTSAYAQVVPSGLVDITQDSSGVIVNDTSYSYTAAQTVAEQSGYTMALFAGRNSTTTVTANMVGKLYSYKIWDNGVLVRDFIPVRKGTVGYLYDRVSGKLFGNAGTGDFVLGPDVVPVEWIRTTGGQCVNTGIMATPNSVIRCTLTPISNIANGMVFWGAGKPDGAAGYGDMVELVDQYSNSGHIVFVGTGRATNGLDFSYGNTLVTTANCSTGALTVNGTTAITANRLLTDTAQYPLYIGCANIAGTRFRGANCMYHSFAIEQSGILVGSFYPVRVGTDATSWEGAMMDVLTRRIYRNAGTGAFTYGNDLKYPIPAS